MLLSMKDHVTHSTRQKISAVTSEVHSPVSNVSCSLRGTFYLSLQVEQGGEGATSGKYMQLSRVKVVINPHCFSP